MRRDTAAGDSVRSILLFAVHAALRFHVSISRHATLGAIRRRSTALTHFVRVARGVMLRGDSGIAVAYEMLPVMALVVVSLCAATWVYRLRLH